MKRHLIFAYETRALNTYPTLINIIEYLSHNGDQVDIMIPDKMLFPNNIKNVNFINCPNLYWYFLILVKNKINNKYYDYIWSTYQVGLLLIGCLNLSERNYIYISMELLEEEWLKELKFSNKKNYRFLSIMFALINILLIINHHSILLNKLLNKFDCILGGLICRSVKKNCVLINSNNVTLIIQDQNRKKVIEHTINNFKNCYLLPNSYLSNTITSDIKFDLIYIGGFEGSVAKSIMDLIQVLPKTISLFLNIYSRDNSLKLLDNIDNENVHVNTNNLSEYELKILVMKSKIGLCWYGEESFVSNHNMYYMGLSSGKLMLYLSCGLPVICSNNLYGYKELIEDNFMGIVCDKVNSIVESYYQILASYDLIQMNVKEYYKKNLDFSINFNLVYSSLLGC